MISIKPLSGIVYLKTNRPKLGGYEVESSLAVESGEVIAVGDGITELKPGDKIVFKSYGLDMVEINGDKYWFCNVENRALLATYEEYETENV